MTRLERLEQQIAELSPAEFAELRAWFTAFDADEWDRQFERDAESGLLDTLGDQALADHRTGRTRPL